VHALSLRFGIATAALALLRWGMAKFTLNIGIFHLNYRGDGNPALLDILHKIEAFPGKKRVGMVIDDPIRPRSRSESP
jgi:hypothetical protein